MEKNTLVLFPSSSQKVYFLTKALCSLGRGEVVISKCNYDFSCSI